MNQLTLPITHFNKLVEIAIDVKTTWVRYNCVGKVIESLRMITAK